VQKFNCRFIWRGSENIHDFYEAVSRMPLHEGNVGWENQENNVQAIVVLGVTYPTLDRLLWLSSLLDVATTVVDRIS
jgi:hypothetical protein